MNNQFKRIKSFSDVKAGDNIVLYYHQSPTSKTVKEKRYYVNFKSEGRMECTRLDKEGKTFRDRWYDTEEAIFYKIREHDDAFTNRYDHNEAIYYASPDIPCGLIINKLMEEKRKINKTIVDLQHLMYSVE